MKRVILSISIAIAVLGVGACQKHSVESLPPKYLRKAGLEAPEPGLDAGKAPAPEAAHKG
jgi:hypothetical protein